MNAGVLLHIEDAPERSLFRVVRACRIARRGTDAAILLLNELAAGELLRLAVPPVVARLLVQALREGLGETIRQSLGHDCVVVIERSAEALAQLFEPYPCGHSKCANEVAQPRLLRRDEV